MSIHHGGTVELTLAGWNEAMLSTANTKPGQVRDQPWLITAGSKGGWAQIVKYGQHQEFIVTWSSLIPTEFEYLLKYPELEGQ